MVTTRSGAWEETLASWARPASDTEDEKKDRAVELISSAIRDDARLPAASMNVYAKGSYANNTNVRRDSDVDVAVEWVDQFYWDQFHGAEQLTQQQLGIVPKTNPLTPSDFKAQVQHALEQVFGAGAVTRHNRCLTVRETSRSLAADVVPCFTYKSFSGNPPTTRIGTVIYPDTGPRKPNWPQQNYENGVAKNEATSRRYKRIVRILKRLENELVDKGISKPVRSYLIECLVYNVPNPHFGHATLTEDVAEALVSIYGATKADDERAKKLLEVNGIMFLFHAGQRWTRQEANGFAAAAYGYLFGK